jgi:acyl transferase domain-containing protein
VHAVIKGTAINNDGALKVGFTAPSMHGQARVIATALSRAGLSPAQIQYIEAHGTGTSLGDPIEIKGLSQVFNRGAGARCLIGSVKTNFGHLDAAAGVAGLIKVVLALRHGRIPASLNFRAPNPRIDFGDGALLVNDRLCDWPASDGPRRAGVSSFGVGGTNAHAVLEQAPPRAHAAASADAPRAFLLSAAHPRSLHALAADLADWIDAHPDADADDVAYTLQVGRNAHAHRMALVCSGLGELREALRGQPQSRICDDESTPAVVFVFPAEAPNMRALAPLHRAQPVFRQHFDRCAELVRLYLEQDLGDLLAVAATSPTPPPDSALGAALTFSLQYASARLWLSFGIQPEAMIGQHLGEYVAACLSGVFSLEEALSLVVVRAQLVETTDPQLPRSERLASIQDTFAACVRETRRGAIGLPLVSAVDGVWIDDAGIADPEYWLRHLRGVDRFEEGLGLLAQQSRRRFLAIGAPAPPAGFARTEGLDTDRVIAMSDADARIGLCRALADLWSQGIDIDWPTTWGERQPGRIPLPTYSFDRQSYWLPPFAPERAGRYESVPGEGAAAAAEREPQRFPRPDLKTAYVAPADGLQRALAEMWQGFLSIERVGADDNFFELGGDSLLGVQVNERLKSDLGIDLGIDKLFMLGTIRNIANYHAVRSGEKTVEDLSDEEVDGLYRAYESA